MDFHPLSQEYPLMPEADLARMEANMRAVGYDPRFPIVRFEGMILEGRNRWTVAARCEIAPPVIDFHGTEEEARAFVETANEHRRHLAPEWLKKRREERVKRVVEAREKGDSIRTIAENEEVSVSQVVRDIEVAGVPPGTPEGKDRKVKGKDGKEYRAATEKPLCPRCERDKRVGNAPAKNCPACKDLRKSDKPTPPKPSPKTDDQTAPKDAFGNDIPKRCRAAYAYPWIQHAIDTIAVIEANLRKERLPDGMNKRKKFYPFANAQDVIDGIAQAMNSLDQVLEHLKECRPAGVCPTCSGEGCGTCRMSGLVPRTLYAELAKSKEVPA